MSGFSMGFDPQKFQVIHDDMVENSARQWMPGASRIKLKSDVFFLNTPPKSNIDTKNGHI